MAAASRHNGVRELIYRRHSLVGILEREFETLTSTIRRVPLLNLAMRKAEGVYRISGVGNGALVTDFALVK